MVYFTEEQLNAILKKISSSIMEYKDNGPPSDDPEDIELYNSTKDESVEDSLDTIATHICDVISRFKF